MKIFSTPYQSFHQRRYCQQLERKAQQIANDMIEQSHQKSLRESLMLTKLAWVLSALREQKANPRYVPGKTN